MVDVKNSQRLMFADGLLAVIKEKRMIKRPGKPPVHRITFFTTDLLEDEYNPGDELRDPLDGAITDDFEDPLYSIRHNNGRVTWFTLEKFDHTKEGGIIDVINQVNYRRMQQFQKEAIDEARRAERGRIAYRKLQRERTAISAEFLKEAKGYKDVTNSSNMKVEVDDADGGS